MTDKNLFEGNRATLAGWLNSDSRTNMVANEWDAFTEAFTDGDLNDLDTFTTYLRRFGEAVLFEVTRARPARATPSSEEGR